MNECPQWDSLGHRVFSQNLAWIILIRFSSTELVLKRRNASPLINAFCVLSGWHYESVY